VDIISGTTTSQDVTLRPLAPCVDVEPIAIHEIVAMGISTTVPMTVSNSGAYTLGWSLSEVDEGFMPMAPQAGEDILVVSEDNADATAIEAALTTLGYTFLDVENSGFTGMSIADLLTYQVVIYAGTMSSGSEENQGIAYLDAGGRLLITDQDYAYFYCDGGSTGGILGPTYLQCHYVSDAGSDGVITGLDIMTGISADISSDPYPDDITIIGPDAVGVFQAPSGNLAGLRIERAGYKAILLDWDYEYIGGAGAGAPEETTILDAALRWMGGDVPWLFEDPDAGDTAAGGTSPVTVTLDASVPEVTQPGDYYATLLLQSDDLVNPEVAVPVTMTVQAPATWGKLAGVVQGMGYCDADPAPIDGAVVFVESGTGMTWTVTTDASGTYSLWLDEMYSPLTVTASYEAGYEAQIVSSVVVTAQMTTSRDFDLRWLEPCISLLPDALEITLSQGATATMSLNLENDGALHSWFGAMELNMGMEPMGPLAVGGPDAFGYSYMDSDELFGPVYQFVDIAGVGNSLSLGDNDSAEIAIGFDFMFYGAVYTSPNTYDTVFVGSNGLLSFGSGSNDLSPDPVLPDPTFPNNIIAAMWDDLAPGAAGMVYYQSFATCPYNPNGDMMASCLVVQYDDYEYAGGGMAGTFQVILLRGGSILIQFADAGDVMGAGSTTGIEDGLGLVGLTYTPALADELAICFAYPGQPGDCTSDDIPWFEAVPMDGSVDADSTEAMTITFDASVPEVYQPGVYMGELWVQSHDPMNPLYVVPVTMTVSQFGGKLEGSVFGWDHCDTVSETLPGADLWVEGFSGDATPVIADADGYYQVWLDEGDNPYSIVVGYLGYVEQTITSVDISSGGTTARDIELRVDMPCLSVTPSTYSVVVPQGSSITQSLSVINGGAGVLDYELTSSMGWLPASPAIGTVAADDSAMVDVTFDATSLMPAMYHGSMEVLHNDPMLERTFVRPIDMLVVGYALTLTPTIDAQIGAPNTTVVYTLTLTNSSTYSDTFDVELTGAGWPTTGPLTVGPVGTDESVDFAVDVDIPLSALSGYSDTVTVTVTSQGDDTKFADALLTTTAGEFEIYLPLVVRNS
jgi:hypothetical protein